MLDGYTGKTIYYIANVTTGGTAVYGKDGSILRYNLVNLGTTAAPTIICKYGTLLQEPCLQVNLEQDTGSGDLQVVLSVVQTRILALLAYNNVHDGRDFYSLNISIPNIFGPRNASIKPNGSIS